MLIPSLSVAPVDISELPLVNFDAVDNPVRILESCRISRDISCTTGILRRVILVAARLLPEVILPSIRSTEGRIKHNIVIRKMVIHNTGASFGGERWRTPSRGVRLAADDVCRNGIGGESPHLDEMSRPFHDHHSTSCRVEWCAV